MKTTHTQGPYWRDDDGFIAAGTGDDYVTFCDTNCNNLDIDDREANTAFIVKACNEYYRNKEVIGALVDALKDCRDDLSRIAANQENISEEDLTDIARPDYNVIEAASAALRLAAKAKEEA